MSSHRTCPSNSRSATCVPHLWRLSFLLSTFLLQCQSRPSPCHPPPQRLSEAVPFVIGISLMRKGWCLSHYSYSEWEYLRTNLLALIREDTFLHQEVHFLAACGNKRTHFVLTLIRWENREFPKEIKKGKRVGVGPWKFPQSRPNPGVQWGTLDSAAYGRLQKAWQVNEKPATHGVQGVKQETWVLVLGPKSLSDLGPVFDFLWSSVLLSGK